MSEAVSSTTAMLQQAAHLLKQGDTSNTASLEAELLLAEVTGRSRVHLKTWPQKQLTPDQKAQFKRLLRRRQQGEPIAYILGKKEFWGREFMVNPSVLIPRPETEDMVDGLLSQYPQAPLKVLDLGCGSGVIAITLQAERPHWQLWGVDISTAALAVASRNADRLLGTARRPQFYASSWFEMVDEVFDLIVSNPPYVESDAPEWSELSYEPTLALQAGPTGLAAIAVIIEQAPPHLNAGGLLMLEHGYQQGAAVRSLFRQRGFEQVETASDLAGKARFTYGAWPHGS